MKKCKDCYFFLSSRFSRNIDRCICVHGFLYGKQIKEDSEICDLFLSPDDPDLFRCLDEYFDYDIEI